MARQQAERTERTERGTRPSRCVVFRATFEPALVHCGGCGKDIMNIDGCPNCGTTRYLTHDRNQ